MAAEITAVPAIEHDGRQDDGVPIEDKEKLDIHHAEQGPDEGLEHVKADILREEADRAEDFEHEMGTWEAFKIYRWVGEMPT